jgi:hypothetical protein
MLKASIAALALVATACPPAYSAKRSFSIPTAAMSPLVGVTDFGLLIIENTGSPLIRINFSLPADYKSGSTVKLRLAFESDKACTGQISVNGVVRARPGTPYIVSVGGVTIEDGGAVPMTPGILTRKTIAFKPTAGFAGQKPGDYFAMLLQRDADASGDTCYSLMALQHGEVRYTAK